MTTYDFGNGPVPAHQHENGCGWVANTAYVEKTCYIGPKALVYDKAQVLGEAQIYGKARVFERALVYGKTKVCKEAQVYGQSQVYGTALVCDEVHVYNKALVYGSAYLYGKAKVSKVGDYFSLDGLEYNLTYTKSNNCLSIGCQRYTIPQWWQISLSEHEPIEKSSCPELTKMFRLLFADQKPK